MKYDGRDQFTIFEERLLIAGLSGASGILSAYKQRHWLTQCLPLIFYFWLNSCASVRRTAADYSSWEHLG